MASKPTFISCHALSVYQEHAGLQLEVFVECALVACCCTARHLLLSARLCAFHIRSTNAYTCRPVCARRHRLVCSICSCTLCVQLCIPASLGYNLCSVWRAQRISAVEKRREGPRVSPLLLQYLMVTEGRQGKAHNKRLLQHLHRQNAVVHFPGFACQLDLQPTTSTAWRATTLHDMTSLATIFTFQGALFH